MVERHQTDSVMLQFGLLQYPPTIPDDMKDFHKISLTNTK